MHNKPICLTLGWWNARYSYFSTFFYYKSVTNNNLVMNKPWSQCHKQSLVLLCYIGIKHYFLKFIHSHICHKQTLVLLCSTGIKYYYCKFIHSRITIFNHSKGISTNDAWEVNKFRIKYCCGFVLLTCSVTSFGEKMPKWSNLKRSFGNF